MPNPSPWGPRRCVDDASGLNSTPLEVRVAHTQTHARKSPTQLVLAVQLPFQMRRSRWKVSFSKDPEMPMACDLPRSFPDKAQDTSVGWHHDKLQSSRRSKACCLTHLKTRSF